jgi:hypothetical protein
MPVLFPVVACPRSSASERATPSLLIRVDRGRGAVRHAVLHDRRLKRQLTGLEPLGPVRQTLHEHRGPV